MGCHVALYTECSGLEGNASLDNIFSIIPRPVYLTNWHRCLCKPVVFILVSADINNLSMFICALHGGNWCSNAKLSQQKTKEQTTRTITPRQLFDVAGLHYLINRLLLHVLVWANARLYFYSFPPMPWKLTQCFRWQGCVSWAGIGGYL